MVDLLKPGIPDNFDTEPIPETLFLEVNRLLGEFETPIQKAEARGNLLVLSNTEVDSEIKKAVEASKKEINNSIESLHQSLETLSGNTTNELLNYRKLDNNTFNSITIEKDASKVTDATNKKYVDTTISNEIEKYDLNLDNKLTAFASTCASVEKVNEINLTISNTIKDIKRNLVKNNVENCFLRPLHYSGRVTTDDTLTNKLYVDKEIENIILKTRGEIEDSLRSYLIEKLSKYAKLKDVYTQSNTYSKYELDSIISNKVDEIIESELENYSLKLKLELDQLFEKDSKSVKIDGSTPFITPLKGVSATKYNELVTLELLEEQSGWKTSGPIETTVGFMEDNMEVPEIMTLLQIMDSIFYGKGVQVTVPEDAIINTSIPVTVCIHGSTSLIDFAELYLNGVKIRTFTKEEFEDGCITVNSEPIDGDTEFVFVVFYENGTSLDDKATVKGNYPVFIGTLPWTKPGNEVSMEYLLERCEEDSENSAMINMSPNVKSIEHDYNFKDAKGRKITIAMPLTYPNLESLVTSSQSFGIEAFNVINSIPYTLESVDAPYVPYKMFIYRDKLPEDRDNMLVKLNQTVTFNFK